MRKWIGLFLTMVLLLNAVCALADPEDSRTPINLVTATSEDMDSIPVYGGPMNAPHITSSDGIVVFTIPQYDMYSYYWYRLEDEEWVQCAQDAVFPQFRRVIAYQRIAVVHPVVV